MTKDIDADLVKSSENQALTQQIISILQTIRFGSMEIVDHNGQVVQLEKK